MERVIGRGLLLVAAVIAVQFGSHAAGAAQFFTLTDPNDAGGGTVAVGLNNTPEVVGTFVNSTNVTQGFSYLISTNTYSTISVPGATATMPGGINGSGEVSGTWQDSGGGLHGFTEIGGTFTTNIDYPGITGNTHATGVNNAGVVVGFYFNGTTNGFTDSGGTYTTVNYPGANATEVLGINSAGTIVGWYRNTLGQPQNGFFYNTSTDTFATADDPLASCSICSTVITGINSAGEIVGYYTDASNDTHGFIDIAGTYTTIDDPNGDDFTEVLGVNDLGQVDGEYIDANGVVHGFYADIPEPATIALLGTVLASVPLARRRRR